MEKVNCAIIEDEPIGLKALEALLKPYQTQFKVKEVGKTVQDARDIFTNPEIDLVFADVELLDGTVFDALKDIEVLENKHIIFTTAYEEFGAKAFNYPAIHYLLKPINPNELDKAITRYRNLVFNEPDDKAPVVAADFGLNKIAMPTQNGMVFIDLKDIIRIQSSNKYSIVFTTEGKQQIVSKSLSRFEELLGKKGFARVHDSHIINLNHVQSYLKGKGGEIIMSDGSQISVAARRKDAIQALLKNPLL